MNMWFLKLVAAFVIVASTYFHSHIWKFWSRFESEPSKAYDFIIVGGGSAGAVIASRLSENENYTVLLVEAGGYPPFFFNIPVISAILSITEFVWKYQTEPQKTSIFGDSSGSISKHSYWPRGKGVGGSSLINFMLYVRGSKYDYDQWEALGNRGWNYANLLPFFLKSEKNFGPSIEEKYHGKNGPLTVEDRVWRSNLPQAFIDAGLELGFNQLDINGENQTGFTIPQLTTDSGARSSTYSAFLKNLKDRRNLKIVTYAQVHKVLIDGNQRAYGVQFDRNGRTKTVNASREVILSAGAVGSPQILMLSGIGPKEHLKQLNIPLHSDLRVGDNLQDHIYVPLTPLVHNDVSAQLSNPLNLLELSKYFLFGNGQYSSSGVDGMAFNATKYSENLQWPDIQLIFLSYSPASDHGICLRKILGLEDEVWEKLFAPLSHIGTASMFATLVRPKSRGFIRLRSTNPLDDPIIDPQYYSNPQDVKTMLEGLKFAKRILETAAMKKYLRVYEVSHPFCESHPFYSDSYLECLIKFMSTTLYHPSGTCKMGPSTDPNAVVDSQLRVKGIKNLRVADASIIPVIPNGNLNAPVIMIGEKAAHIILQHYKGIENPTSKASLYTTHPKEEF